METKYAIRNAENGNYLAALNLSSLRAIEPLYWRGIPRLAFQFKNREEAQATITFISEVLDWELAEQLEIVEV